ncbi:MAG: hypothetical protein ACXWDI_11010 [Nocardioides sp.]
MNTTIKKALVGAAATAITLGLAAPATAATTTITPDALGDMAHGADIDTVKVVNEKAVRIVIQHVDLVPSYTSGAGVTVYLDTDPKDEGPEFAFLGGLFDGTDYGLVRTEGWKVPKHPRTVNKFYIMKLDYENDVTRIRISRAALDKPGKVRVEVKTSGQQDDGDIVRDWLGSRREFIPWVARG